LGTAVLIVINEDPVPMVGGPWLWLTPPKLGVNQTQKATCAKLRHPS
jgi:hypothetical protein